MAWATSAPAIRAQVVGDRGAAGSGDQLVAGRVEPDQLGVDDLDDEFVPVGEDLVRQAERAAGLGGQGPHGERGASLAGDEPAGVLEERGPQCRGRFGRVLTR
jgi:hypothetical protein